MRVFIFCFIIPYTKLNVNTFFLISPPFFEKLWRFFCFLPRQNRLTDVRKRKKVLTAPTSVRTNAKRIAYRGAIKGLCYEAFRRGIHGYGILHSTNTKSRRLPALGDIVFSRSLLLCEHSGSPRPIQQSPGLLNALHTPWARAFRIHRSISPTNTKSRQKPAFCVGGGWWIRTTEVSDNRFTVCPLWPLGKSPI